MFHIISFANREKTARALLSELRHYTV